MTGPLRIRRVHTKTRATAPPFRTVAITPFTLSLTVRVGVKRLPRGGSMGAYTMARAVGNKFRLGFGPCTHGPFDNPQSVTYVDIPYSTIYPTTDGPDHHRLLDACWYQHH